MSRIGRIPIALAKEVKVACDQARVEVAGPKGHLAYQLPRGISVSVEDGKVSVKREHDDRSSRALHGLARSLVSNMVAGVTRGFEKKLEIVGVGFRADVEKNALKLTLGFSHPILYAIPE